MEVNIHEAKTHFSRLLQRVANGEEVTIARAGVPVARLVPVVPKKQDVRPLGFARGEVWVADDFDAPLPDELLKQFYGGTLPKLIDAPRREAQMKYLLDTVAWLWSVHADDRLGDGAREILANGKEEIYLSAASSWELSIKMRLGKLNFPGPPAHSVPSVHGEAGASIAIAVTHLHAVKVYDLPSHHSDPFDRLIIAQAMVEEMTVLTSDRIFEKYPIDVIWCGK